MFPLNPAAIHSDLNKKETKATKCAALKQVLLTGKKVETTKCSTGYFLIYRTAKNNYFGNCPGIIETDFYTACEVSGIIRTSKQLHAS